MAVKSSVAGMMMGGTTLNLNMKKPEKVKRDTNARKSKKVLSPHEQAAKELYESFTDEQKEVFKCVMEGHNAFISGGGGCGKSFLLKGIVATLRNLYNKQCIVVAPTGVAAHHVGGVTIHKQFGFPVEKPCLKEVPKGSGNYMPLEKADMALKMTDCLIIEEVSMVEITVFDSIIASVEKANKWRNKKGIKNIQILAFGDYYQLPPVLTPDFAEFLQKNYYNSTKTCVSGELGGGYAFNSVNWEKLNFKNFLLKEIVRQKNPEMVYHLNKIREGKEGFTNYFNHATRTEPMEDGITLYPYNSQVREENKRRLAKWKGKEYVFKAKLYDNATKEDCEGQYELRLKIGVKVMFLVNDNPERKNGLTKDRPDAYKDKSLFVNGTVGILRNINIDETDHDNDYLTIEIEDTGAQVNLLRNTYEVNKYNITDDGKLNVFTIGKYEQFPICLFFCMSIHKSQGKTFSKVNLNPSAFSPGQLYVALSRATDVEHLYLEDYIREDYVMTSTEVYKFYKELEEKIKKEKELKKENERTSA